jgi:hypothetical protein
MGTEIAIIIDYPSAERNSTTDQEALNSVLGDTMPVLLITNETAKLLNFTQSLFVRLRT